MPLCAVPDLTPLSCNHAHDMHSPPARAHHTSMVLESVVAGDALGRTVVEVVRATLRSLATALPMALDGCS